MQQIGLYGLDCCFCVCNCKESAEKEGRLLFWMPFQLKQTVMKGCTVTVVLFTLTHVAVDGGVLTNILTGSSVLQRIPKVPKVPKLPKLPKLPNMPKMPKLPKLPKVVRNVGGAAKQQKIDPHIDHKIDVFLDLAPSPEETVQDTGYNGTGISGHPRYKESAVIQVWCGKCICKLLVMIHQYGAEMGCTQEVDKLFCTCPPASCYMTQITKCLEKWATGKCKYEMSLFTCP
ncbi:uncharacterized protein [Dermacentor albipictus]|uniref:uncharacterized protein isoform X2 n=1 Tax=Dermacentor albipictus TaxID=60249 RepID=UPI0038FC9819